jgi:hypothetical protein
MKKMKFRRVALTIALIVTFFMFGTGVNKAQSANIDEAGINGIIAEFYKGYAIYLTGLVYEGYSRDNLLEAYNYYSAAASYAYNAYVYAANARNLYAADATNAAYNAYIYLDAAASWSYDGWYYDYSPYTGQALDYAGLANQQLAFLAYYAAWLQ